LENREIMHLVSNRLYDEFLKIAPESFYILPEKLLTRRNRPFVRIWVFSSSHYAPEEVIG